MPNKTAGEKTPLTRLYWRPFRYQRRRRFKFQFVARIVVACARSPCIARRHIVDFLIEDLTNSPILYGIFL